MEENSQKSWWLVTTKPNKEQYAEENLNNQGYKTYRPLAKRQKVYRGVKKTVIESLFPRYIFIHLDQVNDNWTPVRSTYGVSNFVMFGNKPAKVQDEIIKTLMREQNLLAERAIDLDLYKPGDTVRVSEEGLYQNMEGIFRSYDGNERVLILLDIMNTEALLTVSSTGIEKKS